jgi:hypothetical protein
MSRAITGDTITVKPTNNIYTALAGVALVIVILGLVVVYLRANTLFDGGLFGS